MKEYIAQEMKESPAEGYYWIRRKDQKQYIDIVEIYQWSGWRYAHHLLLKGASNALIFYGPIERPKVPE